MMSTAKVEFKKKIIVSMIIFIVTMVLISLVFITTTLAQSSVSAQGLTPEKAGIIKFELIAAALAFGFGALGAGLAIGPVGAAALGALSEKPETFGQALIFVALAEGLVIFGFIAFLMILGKVYW
jgi:V/A-type H+/Na+-transporting ATPase subunit K